MPDEAEIVHKYWRDKYYAEKRKYDDAVDKIYELEAIWNKLIDAEILVAGMERVLLGMYESLKSILGNYNKIQSEAIKDIVPGRSKIFDLEQFKEEMSYNNVEGSIITGKNDVNKYGMDKIDGVFRTEIAKKIASETDIRDTAENAMKNALNALHISGGNL